MQQKIKIGKLQGVLHRPKSKATAGIVMVHGFGGEGLEPEFEDVANSLSRKGFLVLRFLFGGYETGDLTKLTISKEVRELKSAIDFLQKAGARKIGIFAQSLGCAVSILLNDLRASTMVLLAPGINLKDWPPREFGKKKIKELEQSGKTSFIINRRGERRTLGAVFWNDIKRIGSIKEEQVKRIGCPILFIYGTKDRTFELSEYEQIFRWAGQPKEMVVLKGARHVIIQDKKFRKEVIALATEFFLKFL